MIEVYSSSMVIRDISSASSGARRSAMSMSKALVDFQRFILCRIDEVDPSTRFKQVDLFKSVVVERKTCFIPYPFLYSVIHFLHTVLLYYKNSFWVIEFHIFGIMESNNGLERTKMQDKIVIHGAHSP